MNKRFFRYSRNLVIGSLLTISAVGLITAVQAADEICYGVADNDRYGNQDVLVKLFPDGAEPVVMGALGTTSVEASTFDCKGETLYVVDGDRLGTVDLETAEFTPIGTIGKGNGAEGEIKFKDIDALAFNCNTGKLYGTERREHKTPPQNDLLVEINPATGALVPGVFEGGVDYVEVKPTTYTGEVKQDVDAMTWDSTTGSLYISANDGDGKNDVLAVLDTTTGEASIVTAIGETEDIEGLEFSSLSPPCQLYGTTGDDIAAEGGVHGNILYSLLVSPCLGADPQIDNDDFLTNPIGPTIPGTNLGELGDIEALACHAPAASTCKLYAVHDQNLQDSQILTIDPYAQGGPKVSTLGPLYPKHDIEGLVIVPPSIGSKALGKLYGSVGGDGAPLNRKTPPFSGAIYEINRDDGTLTTIPPRTGYYEVSSLTIDPTTNVVWAWAKGDQKWLGKGSKSGPITIDLSNHPSSVLAVLDKEYPLYQPRIEGVAFSNDGKTLYGIERGKTGTIIYGYDIGTKTLTTRCGVSQVAIKGESEALEIQPNGLLLLAIQSSVADLTFVAFDPISCQVKAMQVFSNIVYNDVESIEWPADECAGRSFLSPVAGAENLSLDEAVVPPAVETAIQSAIEKKKLGGEVYTEAGGGATVSVYIDDKVFVVHVTPKRAKSGARAAGEESCAVVDATITDDFSELSFTDSCGNTEVWALESTAVSPAALLAALNQLGEGSVNGGNVSVTLADGTFISGVLSVEVIPPVVPAGGALTLPPEGSVAQIVPGNEDGSFIIEFPTGHRQTLSITNVQ